MNFYQIQFFPHWLAPRASEELLLPISESIYQVTMVCIRSTKTVHLEDRENTIPIMSIYKTRRTLTLINITIQFTIDVVVCNSKYVYCELLHVVLLQ